VFLFSSTEDVSPARQEEDPREADLLAVGPLVVGLQAVDLEDLQEQVAREA